MVEPVKTPPKLLIAAAAGLALVGTLMLYIFSLNSHLKSTTKITQGLRDEVETLRKENESYQNISKTDKTQLESLSAELNGLKEDKDVSARKQEEMKKLVENAEKSLEQQNSRVRDMEKRLKEADDRMKRQSKESDSLEQRTRSAKANPAMTAEYVKVVEREWAAATAKTDELKKDLDRTLAELASQNRDREKLRSDTATMHYNLAVILTEQQNYPAAVMEYKKVLESRPNDADAHYNLGIIYDNYMKDSVNALEHYRQYVKIAPAAPESQRVRQWIRDKEYDNAFKFKL